jgi:predicted O-methyltransferase YrrM
MPPGLHLLPDKLLRQFIRRYRDIDGFLTEREAPALFRAANRLPTGATVVEIGSWKGKSTFCLARGLRPGGRVHAIDPFDGFGEPGSAEIYAAERGPQRLRRQFEENIAPVRNVVEVHQGYSREFVGRFPTIDLLLIDGDHSAEGARYDFEHFTAPIPVGGWLMFHDYYPDRPDLGPSWVVEHLAKTDGRFREFTRADSLWIGRRV